MHKTIQIFHYLSFLAYPFLLLGLYYGYRPFFMEGTDPIADVNMSLLNLGLAMNFLSFIDTARKNKFGIWLYGSKGRVKFMLILGLASTITFIVVGIHSYYISADPKIKELGFGLLMFGIGYAGILRMLIDVIKTYRPEDYPEPISEGS
ncbi:hypothetical protein [Pontibacter sp. G13]|uniref:hypothetical protein n=1 Tax=Pontibacter sp. G13 TaxID=3074898 RepID=UPI00288937C8|nr:hypothetical protein [Pontibacter sp. G13]WNJ20270.1 hypothetical protein RJD25_07305 [Pontibacter sp. G13]